MCKYIIQTYIYIYIYNIYIYIYIYIFFFFNEEHSGAYGMRVVSVLLGTVVHLYFSLSIYIYILYIKCIVHLLVYCL